MAQWFNIYVSVCMCSSGTVLYVPSTPPPHVFVATLPSLPLLNEAGRVAASAPAVGGHRVNPARLPLSLRLPSLYLCHASGLLTAAGTVRKGGEVTGGADTPGVPPPPSSTAE